MDEKQWERCSDPGPMWGHLEAKADARKLRLFACACARRIWDLLTDRWSREVIETAERYADGQASRAALDRARLAARKARNRIKGDKTAADIAQYCGAANVQEAVWNVADVMVSLAVWQQARESPAATRKGFRAETTEMKRQCDLLRELFGNPFRRVRVPAAWLTWNDRTIPRLARAIYEERAFDRLPILADALEEAGCDNKDILRHCRGQQEHVPGCWILDLLR
jgi:hypothetical protein